MAICCASSFINNMLNKAQVPNQEGQAHLTSPARLTIMASSASCSYPGAALAVCRPYPGHTSLIMQVILCPEAQISQCTSQKTHIPYRRAKQNRMHPVLPGVSRHSGVERLKQRCTGAPQMPAMILLEGWTRPACA